MSGRRERDMEREEIREDVRDASIKAWAKIPVGEEPAGYAIDQLAAITLAICNLAETVDARGGGIRIAITEPDPDPLPTDERKS